MKRVAVWFVLAVIAIVLVACGEPEPPHHGVFIQEGRDFIQIHMAQGPSNENLSQIVSSVPVTDEPIPTIILWEPAVWLGDFGLSRILGGIGASMSFSRPYPQVTRFADLSAAYQAGMQQGDYITAIDGVTANGVTDIEQLRRLVSGPINEYMVIDVDRGGQTHQFEVLRVPIDKEDVPITSSSEGDIWKLEPSFPLEPGHYCFIAGNPTLPFARLPTWCFRVES